MSADYPYLQADPAQLPFDCERGTDFRVFSVFSPCTAAGKEKKTLISQVDSGMFWEWSSYNLNTGTDVSVKLNVYKLKIRQPDWNGKKDLHGKARTV